MTEYQEKEKQIARQKCLEEAIVLLTKNRYQSTLARRSYVSDIKNYLMNKGTVTDKQVASRLTEDSITHWEEFYDSIVQTRNPKDLKVAYLASPNPENELEEFVKHGILPENIWAFESNSDTYDRAVLSSLQSRFPYIKIFNIDISSFFKLSPLKFDFIYLDFCGRIASSNKRNKSLHTVVSILSNHVLNSPGVLITNFSFPSKEQDFTGCELLTKLIACYLYPKGFLESNDKNNNLSEGAIAHGLEIEDFLKKVQQDPENYYGQFITRLLIDSACVIVPCLSFAEQSNIFDQFFNINKQNYNTFKEDVNRFYHFDENGTGGNIITDPDYYPLLWSMACLYRGRNLSGSNFAQFIYEDKEFDNLAKLFLRQLSKSQKESHGKIDTVDKLENMLFLLSENEIPKQYYKDNLKTLAEQTWYREIYQFCDVLLFHQLLELLVRQLAIPYHVNIQATTRWTYKAKQTRMFLDLLVLDECRYVYDWMPTIDMLQNGIGNLDRQLAYRFALDAVCKHGRWYNVEYFLGTAVVDQHKPTFEAKQLSPRIRIN